MNSIVLRLNCPDRVGLLHELSGFFAERSFNLTEVRQFSCAQSGNFFVRIEAEKNNGAVDLGELREELRGAVEKLGATWQMRGKHDLYRVAILCSREGHCLADLIWRWKNGDLLFELAGVISNHRLLEKEVRLHDIPYAHIPVEKKDVRGGFGRLEEQLKQWEVDTVVMARYMQIIPADFCRRWEGKIINIHHSFLPAFAGGDAYRQAYERGVKLIGATCHYATEELDEGPIIEQEVIRTSHQQDVGELRRVGQDCERVALARGLKYHLEDRVFRESGRTIILG
jgi:formyltetrahydrofolate deformylase